MMIKKIRWGESGWNRAIEHYKKKRIWHKNKKTSQNEHRNEAENEKQKKREKKYDFV